MGFFWLLLNKRNSSEVVQYSPSGRMPLSLELNRVSSSGISGIADFFRPDVVGSSVRGAFILGGSTPELSATHLLVFFGL